ncbi:DedA family protein [Propionibacteriaceae bacterium Y2011]
MTRTEPEEAADHEPETDESGDEQEWWADPRMPWRGRKPSKADIGCLFAIMGMGIYALAMMPLRPVLLALNPYVLAAISGSSIAMATIGAYAAVDGGFWWVFGLLVGTLSIIKFDWIYWWAGRLWGQGLIDYLLQGRSERAKRNAARAQKLTHRYETLALAATYIPLVPIPAAIIYGALGISGTSLRKFLILDIVFALITRAGYMALGFWVGQPAVDFLEIYGRYAWYLSIAIIVGIVVVSIVRSQRKAKAAADS